MRTPKGWRDLVLSLSLSLSLSLVGCSQGELVSAPVELPVRVEALQSGTLPTELSVPAEIRAGRTVTLSALASGEVERVGPRVGDAVRQGEPVVWLAQNALQSQVREQQAQMDAARSAIRERQAQLTLTQQDIVHQKAQAVESVRQAEIAVSQAQTQLDSAKNELDRKQGLLEEKAIAQTQVEQARLQWEVSQDQLKTAQSKLQAALAEQRWAQGSAAKIAQQQAQIEASQADLRRAQASLDSARLALEQTVIKAPLSGVVTERKVEPGQAVSQGQGGLMTLVDNSQLELQAAIDQRYAPRLQPGLPGLVTSLQYPGRSFPVRLKESLGSTDPTTNTLNVRFSFEEHLPGLVDGTSVQLRLHLGESRGLLVPRAALVTSGRGQFVLRVVKGLTEARAVRPLLENEAHALIAEGEELQVGDLVIVEGYRELRDGQPVSVEARP